MNNFFNSPNAFDDIFGSVFTGESINFSNETYEERLDNMWRQYGKGNIQQLKNYDEQVHYLKGSGYKVFRNKEGKHKIVKN